MTSDETMTYNLTRIVETMIERQFKMHLDAYDHDKLKPTNEEDKEIRITKDEAIRVLKFLKSGDCVKGIYTCPECPLYDESSSSSESCLSVHVRKSFWGESE